MKLLKKYLPIIVTFVSLGFAVWFIILHPTVPDTWTRMGLGKYIIQNRTIPFHKDISFKDVGQSFSFLEHSWLGDSLIYIAMSTGQIIGTVFLLIPTLLISLFILYRTLKLLAIRSEIIYAALSLSAVISLTFWRLHALIFLTPVMLLVLHLYLLWKTQRTKLYYALPVVFIGCANIAGGFVLIPMIFLLTLVVLEVVRAIFTRNRSDHADSQNNSLRSFVGIALLSVLSIGLNPVGFVVIIYGLITSYLIQPLNLVANIVNILNISSQSYVKNGPSLFLYTLYTVYFLCALLLFGLLTIRTKAQILKRVLPLLPLIIFFILPFYWLRLIPVATFLSMPLFALLLNIYVDANEKSRLRLVTPIIWLAALSYTIFLFLNPLRTVVFDPPIDQIAFIKEHDLPQNLMTSPDLTGYVFYNLYPQKVLFDLQDDMFDENSSIQTYTTSEIIQNKIIDEILQKNSINSILINRDYGFLAVNINQNPDWSLVYFDDNGYVFVRNAMLPKSKLSTIALGRINLGRNLGYDPTEATASAQELVKFTKRYKSRLALGQLATIYRLSNQLQKAEEALNKIPKKRWDFTVYTEMGRVKAGQGLCKQAENNLLLAIEDRGEENFSRAVLDLAVVYAGCLKDPIKAAHYFKRYNSYIIPPSEHARVQKIADDFNIKINDY